jgi:hypothetical protein
MSIFSSTVRDMVSLLRGWKIPIYLFVIFNLSLTYVILSYTSYQYRSPYEEIITTGFFVNLIIALCIIIFFVDEIPSEMKSGLIINNMLLPKKRTYYLKSKIIPPILFYIISIIIFSLYIITIPTGICFQKLWLLRIIIDTALFFTLLFLSVSISISFSPNITTTINVIIILLFILFSPYTFITTPYLEYFNPVACEYSIMNGLTHGVINFLPIFSLILFLLILMAYSFYRIESMEVFI